MATRERKGSGPGTIAGMARRIALAWLGIAVWTLAGFAPLPGPSGGDAPSPIFRGVWPDRSSREAVILHTSEGPLRRGEAIVGIRLLRQSDMTPVRVWADVERFLATTSGSPLVVQVRDLEGLVGEALVHRTGPIPTEPAPPTVTLPAERALDAEEIYARFARAVAVVRTESSVGTGFIDPSGRLITCHHVVAEASRIEVALPGRDPVELDAASMVALGHDLVALRLPDPPPGLRLGDETDLPIGSKVFVIGAPQGLAQSITEGILSSKRNEGDDLLLQITAPISPGSSGSPVFDRFGRVVGIVAALRPDGQQLNFALPVRHLRQSGRIER